MTILYVVLGLLTVAALALLLPALPASRDTARANLCRRNLGALHQLTSDYLITHQRLPNAATWPVDLLPRLQFRGTGQQRNDVFSMARPSYLTCPARVDPARAADEAEPSHYTLIVDRVARRGQAAPMWSYRDAPVDLAPDQQSAWYIGRELTYVDSIRQLEQSRGPHVAGGFLEIDQDAKIRTLVPKPGATGKANDAAG